MLEHLSPREFEEYCQVLLAAFHRCQVDVTQQTRDGGRDLFVHHTTGLWVVECKHWPTGTVGRPVVQKLHSATLTANSRRALIVTTGRFSQDAEIYANALKDVAIELIDMAKLAHMISITFPKGSLPGHQLVAVKTTSDAAFPQTFAQSIFSEERYKSEAKNPVRVTRNTHYEAYYLAKYRAEGLVKTAVGYFSKTWEGSLWLSADGRDAGFGSPKAHGRKLTPLIELTDAIALVPGDSHPPDLQPHRAVAKMKEFVGGNCSEPVSYKGRNNVSYSATIQPSSSSITIESLNLCYIPFQTFTLEIGGNRFEGEVDERGKPTEFHVDCPELSTCTVCGTATTEDDQILCSVCFRPAHKASLFYPDSFNCEKCDSTVCRKHAVNDDGHTLCTRCAIGGKSLQPRWFAHCMFGVVLTVITAFALLASLALSVFVEQAFALVFLAVLISSPFVLILSWVPWLVVVLQKPFRRRHRTLSYLKVMD